MGSLSDEDLLAGIAKGEPDWRAVYERCRHAMHAAAMRYFRRREEALGGLSAEDVVQQVMSAVIRKGLPDDLASVEKLRAYMAQATLFRAHNVKTRKPAGHLPLADPGTPDELPGTDDVEETAVTIAVADHAKQLVQRLPGLEQLVIRRHVLEGHRQIDVAAEIGVSDARVRQLLKAGLRRLRRLLADESVSVGQEEGG